MNSVGRNYCLTITIAHVGDWRVNVVPFVARHGPFLRQQTGSPISRRGLGDMPGMVAKGEHIVSGRAALFADNLTRFVAVQIRRVSSKRQKTADSVGVQQSAI